MNCPTCNAENAPDAAFCSRCGRKFLSDLGEPCGPDEKIRFRRLFSRVLVRHSAEETERYFILGTPQTTPDIRQIAGLQPRPWFFARVLLTALLAYAGFYAGLMVFGNLNFLPGLIFIGAFMTPISLLIFFWEINVPRDISIYRLLLFFLMGGLVALLYSMIIYTVIDGNMSSLLVGFVEETAKVLAFLPFLSGRRYRYILSGMLIGAAVGTGFSAFESSGYILLSALQYGVPTMLHTIFWRAILAPGGHIAWAGLTGAALMAVKGDRPFELDMLRRFRFLGTYVLVILLHAAWDAQIPQPVLYDIPLLPVALTLVSWVMLFWLMKRGFRQVMRLESSSAPES